MMDEITKRFAQQLVAKKEAVLFTEISNTLGDEIPTAWSELKGRVEAVSRLDGAELYYLDGKPLVIFYPPDFSTDSREHQAVIKATVSYQRLNSDGSATTTKICPECGSVALVELRTHEQGQKYCGNCEHMIPWKLDPGQKPLL